MKPINDYIVERIRIDNISMDTLPENLKKKYKLIYNPDTRMYDCDDDITINGDLIENGQFKCNFGVVKGYFDCSYYISLTSLKGAPKKVGDDFICNNCDSLKTLEGASEEVGGDFNCYNCKSLTSLEGAPKKVGGNFYCNNCKSLTSLEGAPKKVGGSFDCYNCPNLKDYNIKTKIGGKFVK